MSNPIGRLLQDLVSPRSVLRADAASRLGQSGDPDAVEPLIAALADDDRVARSAVVSALAALGDARAVEPIFAVLRDPDGDTWLDQVAGLALGRFGREAVAPLIVALSDESENVLVRAYAARGLGEIGDQRAFLPLCDALAYPDTHIRGASVEALGTLGDRRAVEPLINILIAQDEDYVVRASAAYSLVQLNDDRAIQPMIDMLHDPDPRIRREVAYDLGELRDPRSRPALERAKHEDEDQQVREHATRAIERLPQ